MLCEPNSLSAFSLPLPLPYLARFLVVILGYVPSRSPPNVSLWLCLRYTSLLPSRMHVHANLDSSINCAPEDGFNIMNECEHVYPSRNCVTKYSVCSTLTYGVNTASRMIQSDARMR